MIDNSATLKRESVETGGDGIKFDAADHGHARRRAGERDEAKAVAAEFQHLAERLAEFYRFGRGEYGRVKRDRHRAESRIGAFYSVGKLTVALLAASA